ncbi:hypothetical protein [Listeria costaricensis]|uniref:hypothetical protein n=1 Tax=Listeria costaricensis TaxID=2026604 RepID=UPI000C06A9D6|nr:hypothetical protein [Listeria costaricensis]
MKYLLNVVCIVLVLVMGFFMIQDKQEIKSLKNDLSEVQKQNTDLEEQISVEAQQTNDAFLRSFFTYDSTNEQKKQCKKMLTDEGMDIAFPYPTSDAKVSSELASSEMYEKKVSNDRTLFLNDVQVKNTYAGTTSSLHMIVRTELVKEKKEWKVNNISIVASYM